MSLEIIRAQTVKGLTASGYPEARANQVADVAVHAVRNAIDAIVRTTNTLEGSDWGNAHSIALQLVAEYARQTHEDLQARVAAQGIPHSYFDVDTRQ